MSARCSEAAGAANSVRHDICCWQRKNFGVRILTCMLGSAVPCKTIKACDLNTSTMSCQCFLYDHVMRHLGLANMGRDAAHWVLKIQMASRCTIRFTIWTDVP